jgi:hypothetical protein
MKITLGPAFFQFYCTLSHCCHPAVAKSKSHSTPLQILSIESFIIELIGLPAHHNSEEVSTKLLRHLVSISNLEYQEVTSSEDKPENGNLLLILHTRLMGYCFAWQGYSSLATSYLCKSLLHMSE